MKKYIFTNKKAFLLPRAKVILGPRRLIVTEGKETIVTPYSKIFIKRQETTGWLLLEYGTCLGNYAIYIYPVAADQSRAPFPSIPVSQTTGSFGKK